MTDDRPWEEGEWNDQQRRFLATHEAGHAAACFMFSRPITFASIRPGAHFAGVVHRRRTPMTGWDRFRPELPAIVAPAAFRRAIEIDICIALAGKICEDMHRPPYSGYVTPSPDEETAKRLATSLASLSLRERESLEEVETDTAGFPSDEENARKNSWVLAGEEAMEHLAYLRAVTRSLLGNSRFAGYVEALRPVLLDRTVLSGRAISRICRETLPEQPTPKFEIAASTNWRNR